MKTLIALALCVVAFLGCVAAVEQPEEVGHGDLAIQATGCYLVRYGWTMPYPGTSGAACGSGGEVCDVCEAGETCVAGDCRVVCVSDSDCDDGNECTSDLCSLGECINAAVTYPKVCGTSGHCWQGACCDGGNCWDMSASMCVDQCPAGQTCSWRDACE